MLRCIQLFHSPNHIIQAEVYRNIFEVKNIKSNTTDQNLGFHISKILVTEYSHVVLLCKINYAVNCLRLLTIRKQDAHSEKPIVAYQNHYHLLTILDRVLGSTIWSKHRALSRTCMCLRCTQSMATISVQVKQIILSIPVKIYTQFPFSIECGFFCSK